MIRATILVVILATFACSKKEEGAGPAQNEPAPPPEAKEKAPPPSNDPPAGPKVFEYPTAQALDADYRSVEGAAFMDKFGLDGKFRVSDTIASLITEEGGNTSVGFVIEGNKRVSLSFADDGKAVAAKGLKKGDAIKVLCDAGGADDNLIMLIKCTLE